MTPQRVTVDIALRWGDLDALGHVNNATMARLLEEARFRGFWGAPGGSPAPGFEEAVVEGDRQGRRTVVARQEIEYLRQLPYRAAPVQVGLWFTRIGGASFDVAYELSAEEAEGRVVYAIASTVLVMVDADTGAPRRITLAERSAWEAYLGEPPRFRRSR